MDRCFPDHSDDKNIFGSIALLTLPYSQSDVSTNHEFTYSPRANEVFKEILSCLLHNFNPAKTNFGQFIGYFRKLFCFVFQVSTMPFARSSVCRSTPSTCLSMWRSNSFRTWTRHSNVPTVEERGILMSDSWRTRTSNVRQLKNKDF